MQRLFSSLNPAGFLSSSQIKYLSQTMYTNDPNYQKQIEMDAGLTYLAQMISHDITPSSRSTKRNVDPYLNLGSIYGNGQYDPNLFEKNTSIFKLREDSTDNFLDLKRTRKFVAEIPEPRNDENIIISQIHLLFLRLHNLIIKSNIITNPQDINGSILCAKDIVTLTFQYITIEIFLKQIMDDRVFKYFFVENGNYFYNTSPYSYVPLEFSHAAFRFGHTIVRPSYEINNKEEELGSIFRPNQELEKKYVLKFENIFSKGEGDTDFQRAMWIDWTISEGMRNIPLGIDIAKKNIRSCMLAELATGVAIVENLKSSSQEISDLFSAPPIHLSGIDIPDRFIEMVEGTNSTSRAFVNDDNLPLWMYILLEADHFYNKKRLGPLGSFLVGLVLKNAILNSQISYLRQTNFKRLFLRDVYSSLHCSFKTGICKNITDTSLPITSICEIDALCKEGEKNVQPSD